MSNLDIVHEGYAAFGRGDMQTFMGLCDPAIEWVYWGAVPWAGQFRGHDEVMRFFGIIAKTLEFEAFEPSQFIVDGDNIAVLGRTAASVKGSGGRFDNNWAHVITMRGGKLVRYVGYDTSAIPH